MSEHRWSWSAEKRLPSTKGAHIPLMEEILQQLQRLGWDKECRDHFGIEMALEESLSNAIRHGNCYDASKYVLVECKASADRFWLRVTDEGIWIPTERRARLHSRREFGMPRRPRPGTYEGLHDSRGIQQARQLRDDGKNTHFLGQSVT